MRTRRQRMFDSLYYNLELWLVARYNDRSIFNAIGMKSFGPEFNTAFREKIRPYWARFGVRVKKLWFKDLYHLTGSTDPRYIPQSLFHEKILPHFDEPAYVRQLADKNLHTLLFPAIRRPETIFKCIGRSYMEDDFLPIPREEAVSRLKQEGDFVIKPSRDSGQGSDIQFFRGPLSDSELESLLSAYDGKTDYIVQRAVRQHPDLARFNPSSLNTLRIVTLVFEDRPYILSSILRIGGPGSHVDNVSKGGYQCTIRPDGHLEPLAYAYRNGQGAMVADNGAGIRWGDCSIPGFDEVRRTAMDLALRLPHLKLIGWDLALDEQGRIVLIEFNCQIDQNQATCGPTFGDLTEDVLSDVFGKKS